MRPLYCIAYELYSRKGHLLKGDLEYVHADSVAHARNQFCYSNPNRRTHKVVGVAPVIGFYVDDKKGEVLSV